MQHCRQLWSGTIIGKFDACSADPRSWWQASPLGRKYEAADVTRPHALSCIAFLQEQTIVRLSDRRGAHTEVRVSRAVWLSPVPGYNYG